MRASKIDKWVYMKALQACANDFHLTLLRAVNLKNFSQSDRDTCNQLAFGTLEKMVTKSETLLPLKYDTYIFQLKSEKQKQFDRYKSL